MVDWPAVIDADGHVLERQSDIKKYLEPPWNLREGSVWPGDQPWDSSMFGRLPGYADYPSGMSPAEQVEKWIKIMDQ